MAASGYAKPVSLPVVPEKARTGIDYELLLDCVHCGLCLSACPTYLELGTEMDSPRGRIYLMRAVADGRAKVDATLRRHLDLCLDCRACESACPSGVQYGKLIEPFRSFLNQSAPNESNLSSLQRMLLFQVFPFRRRARLVLTLIRWLQKSGVDNLLRSLLPRGLRAMHDMLPRLKSGQDRLPEMLPAHGKRRARVALFVGCVSDGVFPETTLATAEVLQRNGCDVWIPRAQTCCGAIHYHSGRELPAKELAQANCAVFDQNSLASLDAIIVNAAGCGAMLKDYGHLLRDTPAADSAAKLAAKSRDISEFLMELGPVHPTHPITIRAAYHDPCHLCHAQQVRHQPRQLLSMIPGLTLCPLPESEICCGAAGTYNVSQPEMAEQLGERKARYIREIDADAVLTGNVGCIMQIGRHLRKHGSKIPVLHPVDILWASYSGNMQVIAEITPSIANSTHGQM